MASAAAAPAGEASTSEPTERGKPIVVRVKRKPSQTRPDAFWLEINERPAKKAMLDFSSLSISDPPSSSSASAKASEEPRVKKLLVQHIETVHHSEAVEDVLHSLLLADSNSKEIKSKTKEWNDRIKQDKKPEELRSAARQRHEDMGRNARFAQIWKSRKGENNDADDSLREICHLYDAVQVDPDDEKHRAEPRITSFEEGAVLCNFLPLIREYLPSAAEEIESDIISLAQSEDSEVYDIYTVKEVDDTNMEATSAASYPRLQVDDGEDECYEDDYPYDTDDSNAEDNPLYDYPDELSEDEDDGSNDEDPFGDEEGSDSEYEKEEVEAEEE
ncbi:RNA-directed DNA methylation 4-like isoform X2 [Miscanthus floridulus]|uniref:RNA-directed DNA methylation 4-like isoform X2 n=1 Tax=Miscanthus floridulus TaxID=154761 RepID=UPI003457DC49